MFVHDSPDPSSIASPPPPPHPRALHCTAQPCPALHCTAPSFSHHTALHGSFLCVRAHTESRVQTQTAALQGSPAGVSKFTAVFLSTNPDYVLRSVPCFAAAFLLTIFLLLLLLLLLCFLLLTWFKTDLLTNNYCASSWGFTTKLLALARKKGFCYAISLHLFLGLFSCFSVVSSVFLSPLVSPCTTLTYSCGSCVSLRCEALFCFFVPFRLCVTEFCFLSFSFCLFICFFFGGCFPLLK